MILELIPALDGSGAAACKCVLLLDGRARPHSVTFTTPFVRKIYPAPRFLVCSAREAVGPVYWRIRAAGSDMLLARNNRPMTHKGYMLTLNARENEVHHNVGFFEAEG